VTQARRLLECFYFARHLPASREVVVVACACHSCSGVGPTALDRPTALHLGCGLPRPAGKDAAVMGLVLQSAPGPSGPRLSTLYVVTESQTLSFNLETGAKVGRVCLSAL